MTLIKGARGEDCRTVSPFFFKKKAILSGCFPSPPPLGDTQLPLSLA